MVAALGLHLLAALALLAALSLPVGCASGPQVSPVTARFLGPVGSTPVPAEAVEVIPKIDRREREPIAELEAKTDGSSFDALVARLRERSGRLGADALVDVRPIYDVGTGGSAASSDDPNGEVGGEAAKAGLTILLNRPKWVAVRGTAVRFPARHSHEKLFRTYDGTDSRPSPTLAAQQVDVSNRKPQGPAEATPVDKP
ncbi:MAG: hypothetical protein JNJ88_14515 [Planctomycetes bacterium]|nr:hypothetical protein [Planctomycetota bacterium]